MDIKWICNVSMYHKKAFVFTFFIFLCIPYNTNASIIINEIAWMGTDVSANNEWIELFNNGGSDVNIEGWILSDGINLEILFTDTLLTGTIGAGQYAMLERTDDSSADGVAFLIYTGALVNTGATLSLHNSDGSLQHSVAGGENWQNIGGDNTTKETAQYTESGWLTAVATPGKKNIYATPNNTAQPDSQGVTNKTTTSNQNNTNVRNISSQSSNRNANKSSSKSSPDTAKRELSLILDIPKYVHVNQEIPMKVTPSGLSATLLNSLKHSWNFGDLSVASGKYVRHRFSYPGSYVVTVHSVFKTREAYARQIVVVLPVSFSITMSSLGDIQVHNDSKYEIDVSGYTIKSIRTFQFPTRTIMLPMATITIPKDKIKHEEGHEVVLKDEILTIVATMNNSSQLQQYISETSQAVPAYTTKTPINVSVSSSIGYDNLDNFTFIKHNSSEVDSSLKKEASIVAIENSESIIANPLLNPTLNDNPNSNKLPYFALLAVIGIGILGVFIGRPITKTSNSNHQISTK